MKTTNVLVLTAAAFARLAHADSSYCTAITALPTTLSNPGVYCLTQDLTFPGTSGAAVTIDANSVSLDLNGHALRGTGAANVSTVGVNVTGQRYFSISDGAITGFSRGVAVVTAGSARSKGGLIADLRVQRSFLYGLLVDCDGCVVRNNLVTDTSTPASFTGDGATGIGVEGTGDQVSGNRVYNTTSATGAQTNAFAVGAANSVIAGNYATNNQTGSGQIYGFIISGANALLSANQAQNFPFCYWLQGVNMKYRDNLSGGCTDAFDGGSSGGTSDLGGND